MKNLEMGGVSSIGASLNQAATALASISKSATGIDGAAGAMQRLATATRSLVEAQAGLRNAGEVVGAKGSRGAGATGPTQHGGPPMASVVPGNNYQSPMPINGFGEPWRQTSASNRPVSPGYSVVPWAPNWQSGGSRGYPYPGGMNAFRTALPPGHVDPGPFGQYGHYFRSGGRPTQMRQQSDGVYRIAQPSFSGRTANGGIGGSRGAGGGLVPDSFNSFLPFGTMVKYGLAGGAVYGGYRAAKYGVTDILGGNARKDIVKENSRLFSVGMNQDEAADIEASGRRFSGKYPWVSTPEYMKTAAESGSYYPNMPKSFWKSNAETSIKFAKSGQFKDNFQANRIFNDTIKLRLNALPAKQQQEALNGKNNTLSQLQNDTYAKLGALFESSPTWAKDWGDYQKYAMATLLKRGVPFENILGRLAVMRPGYRASTLGRADTRLFTKEAATFAKLQMGAEGITPENTKKGQYGKLVKQRANTISGRMSKDSAGVFTEAYQNVENLKAQGVNDPLTSIGGASQNFRSAYETAIEPGINQQIAQESAKIGQNTLGRQDSKIDQNIDQLTTGMQKVTNSLGLLAESLAKTHGAFEKFNQLAEFINKQTQKNDQQTSVDKKIDKAKKDYPLWSGKNQPAEERWQTIKSMRENGVSDDMVMKYARETDPKRKKNPWSSQFVDDLDYVKSYIPKVPGMSMFSDAVKDYNPLNMVSRGLQWAAPGVFGDDAQKGKVDNLIEKAPPLVTDDPKYDRFKGSDGGGGGNLSGSAHDLSGAASELKSAAHALSNIKIPTAAAAGGSMANQTAAPGPRK